MAYRNATSTKVIQLRPPRPAAGVGLDLGFGTSVGSGGITIDASQIAQKIVDIMWPPIDVKINQVEARVNQLATNKINEVKGLIPGVANMAIDTAKARLPELINVAWPLVETKANTFIGKYENRYIGMIDQRIGPFVALSKYATPVMIGLGVVGVLVTAASLKTLFKK